MPPRAESSTTDAAPMLLVTCEHASKDVPPELRSLFRGKSALLRSHRGWDIGALEIAERIAAELSAPLMVGRWTRLVVDLNRSPTNPAVLSDAMRVLRKADRLALLEKYHAPYRRAVETLASRMIDGGNRVIHISVHTFTPVLDGKMRAVDVGLLFDPKREAETAIARRWKRGIERCVQLAPRAASAPKQCDRPPALRIRMNQPYRGVSDGLATHLRTRFPADRYAGLELEVNQRFFAPGAAGRSERQGLIAAIIEGLREAVTAAAKAH